MDRLLNIFGVAVLVRAAKALSRDQGTLASAAIAYYAFLSVFPLAIAVILIFSMFMPEEEIRQDVTQFLEENVPASVGVIDDAINGVLSNPGTAGIVSILVLIWTGSAVFGAITQVINRAWAVEETPPFYIQKAKQLLEAVSVTAVVGLSIAITAVVGIASGLPGPFAEDSGAGGRIISEVTSRGASLLLSFLVFVLIYYFVPNTETAFRGVLPGAIFAAIAFEIGKGLFVWYMSEFASFGETYGPLAGAVVLLVWLYYSALILVFGAEFNVAWWAEKEEREGHPMPAPGHGASRRAVPHG